MEETRIIHIYDKQPPVVKVKLERNSKGYNWEISYEHEDLDIALAKIREANERLKTEYGGGQ